MMTLIIVVACATDMVDTIKTMLLDVAGSSNLQEKSDSYWLIVDEVCLVLARLILRGYHHPQWDM